MADSNTRFKAEHGIHAVESSLFSSIVEFSANLDINAVVDATGGSFLNVIPNSNAATHLGNSTMQWILHSSNGIFTGNVSVSDTVNTKDLQATGNVYPSANGKYLGNTTNRWDVSATNLSAIVATVNTITSNASIVLSTANSDFVANSTVFYANTGDFRVNTGKEILKVLGNTTTAAVTLESNTLNVSGNVAFDTTLLVLDAANNKISIGNATFNATHPLNISTNTVLTFSSFLTFLGNTSATVQNSHISHSSTNTLIGTMLFSTYDASNTSVDVGGFTFRGVANSTNTHSVMFFNSQKFEYKSGNVVHAGNFGIYDISGNRVGP